MELTDEQRSYMLVSLTPNTDGVGCYWCRGREQDGATWYTVDGHQLGLHHNGCQILAGMQANVELWREYPDDQTDLPVTEKPHKPLPWAGMR